MTALDIVLIGLLWILLGLFICSKANWYEYRNRENGEDILSCIMTIIFSPTVFLADFINRFFIQKWH